MTALAETLAEFAAGLDTPPPATLRRVLGVITDQVGLQLACSRLPWSAAVVRYLKLFPTAGDCPVPGWGMRTGPEQAAFAAACFGHGQDFDDTCPLVQSHVGATIVPVALALGAHTGASGAQVVRAVSAGAEVMLRVAHAGSPGILARGHHTPVAAGPFGAAVTAALFLDPEASGTAATVGHLDQAMRIAGSFAGGLAEYTQAGGSVKRLHMAIPAAAGVRAAYLAKFGITGPASVLEGAKGFLRAFSDTPYPERLTDGLGRRLLIDEVGMKRFNCCYFIHAPLEGYLSLAAEHALAATDIAAIVVGTSAQGVHHVGAIPEPQDALGGQFSTHFTLAMGVKGLLPGVGSYTPEQLADPELREIARTVSVVEDPVCTAEYPSNFGGTVTVTTTDGRVFDARVRHPRGTAENPLSDAEFAAKLAGNLDAGPPVDADALASALTDLPDLPDIRKLTDLLVVPDA